MLTICPTPIGNLADVTPRQREALVSADIIACEDTRTTGKLLELLGVERREGKPALVSYHEHNERERTPSLVEAMEGGARVVLVSDAGTPGISDPGYHLVKAASEAGLKVEALPGPMAGIVALSASGLPTDRFFFEGFVPSRRKARQERLQELDRLGVTIVLYEAPHRVLELLGDVLEVSGVTREVCVARELTKLHEEYLRGPVGDVLAELEGRERLRGEFVVVLGPVGEAEDEAERRGEEIDQKIEELLEQGMRPRGIKEVVAELYGLRKSEIYDRIDQVKARMK